MKKYFPLFLMIVFAAANLFGQDKKPSPTPPLDTDVVKISTKLVQVDVTVTDKNGRTVRDLKPDEIEIYQNGKKQDITNFSFVSIAGETNEGQKAKPKTQTPGVVLPPTPVKAENVRRTIALVVADVSFQSLSYVRRALRKFVDESMQEGDLVAIVRTSSGSGVLQQFTTDKRLLRAAIDDIRFDPFRNSELAFAPITPANADAKPSQEDHDKEIDSFREAGFVSGMLAALNFIVRGMHDLPGRKSVMLLSDGFPLIIRGPGNMMYSMIEDIHRVVDSATRASVTINTADARGLVNAGLTTADDLTDSNGVTISGRAMLGKVVARNFEVVDSQQGPRVLAEQTGGIAFANNNDLSGGIRRILDDQSYYLIGYQPDDSTFDPKARPFNRLQLKVKRPGLTVRYRSGFFGVSDENIAGPKPTSGQRLVTALISPFAVNEIGLRLNAIFNNNAEQGSHIRSLLHIRAQELTFTDGPNGSKTAVFDVIAAGIDENGFPFDTINQSYTLTANKSVYERYMVDGFVYGFTFPVKRAGAYQLRVALRDRGSDKIGSANQLVEVPDIGNKRLTLSGVILENSAPEEWNKRNTISAEAGKDVGTNSLKDTSQRRFKRGSILSYAFVVFNAKLDAGLKPNLSMQIKVYRDGKMIMDGTPEIIPFDGQSDMQRIGAGGSLNLGGGLQTGDYVIQIVVKDSLAKEKLQYSTQFVQFEVIE